MKKSTIYFLMLVAMCISSHSLQAQTYNGGVWYSFYNEMFDIYTIGSKSFDVFAPTKDSLRLTYKYAGGVTAISPFQFQETDIYESSNGTTNIEEMTHIGDADGIKRYDVYTSIPVSANINKILFNRAINNTYGVDYKNVNILLANHILLAEGEYGTNALSASFAATKVGESVDTTIYLRSFLSAADITLTSDNPAFRVAGANEAGVATWTVGANACASANGVEGVMVSEGVLGDIHQYAITISFCPTYVQDYNGTITITDGVSTATISLSGAGYVDQKYEQTITWEDDLTNLSVFDNITLNASANTAITYATSNADIATVEGNQLVLHNAGNVTIYAYAAEDAMYLPDTLTKEIEVSPLTQTITWDLDSTIITVGDTLILNATASSGLDVTYELAPAGMATLDGNMLIAQEVGNVDVVASQVGNNNYVPAEPVTYIITIIAKDINTACPALQVAQPKARKLLRNGRIIIIRDDKEYNTMGAGIR